MTERDGRSATDYFYNATSGLAALRKLGDAAKVSVTDGAANWPLQWTLGAFAGRPKPVCAQVRHDFWGHVVPPGSGDSDFRIGVMGKIWALLALRCELIGSVETREVFGQPNQLTEQLADCAETAARGGPTRATFQRGFPGLTNIRRPLQKGACDDLDGHAGAYLQAAVTFCAKDIAKHNTDYDETQLKQQLKSAVTLSDAATVGDQYDHLCRVLGLEANGKSWVEPSVLTYIGRRQGQTDEPLSAVEKAQDLERAVLLRGARRSRTRGRIVGLWGEAHAGKKSVIGELLLRNQTEGFPDFEFMLPDDQKGPDTPLPVFCIDTSRRSYYQLLRAVLDFLVRLRPAASTAPPAQDEPRDMAAMLSRIETLHKGFPALFIFMDVEGLSYEAPNRIIERRGFRRLLRRLFESEHDSRFILTVQKEEKDAATYDLINLPQKIVWQKVDDPTIDRLAWYLDDGPAFLDALERAASNAPRPVLRGEDMLALSLLEPDRGVAYIGFEGTVRNFVTCAANAAENAQHFVFDELVAFLDRSGALQAALLVATSIDGITEHSLRECLSNWLEDAPGDFPKVLRNPLANNDVVQNETIAADNARNRVVAIDSAIDWINRLSRKGKGLFLRYGDPVHHDVQEHAFDEPGGHPNDPPPKTWSFSVRASGELIRAVSRSRNKDHKNLVSHAHRAIARAARRRGQIKKIRADEKDPFFTTQHVGRDVQAYIALLTSLEPERLGGLPDPDDADRSPLFYPDLVFSMEEDENDYPAALALRFAVMIMLLRDIDLNGRLSIQSVDDSLRLLLYTLPFATQRPLRLSPYSERQDEWLSRNELPQNEVPKWLRDTLGDKTVIELLTTVAVSAYYCDRPGMIAWARRLATPLFETDKNGMLKPFTRILLCEIDCSVRQGRWLFDDNFGVTPPKNTDRFPNILPKIESHMALVLPGFSKSYKRPPPKGASYDQITAFMQFQARRAEVFWHTQGDTGQYESIFNSLDTLEKNRLKEEPLKLPAVFSGRSARRRIRALLRDYPILETDRDSLLQNLEPMRETDLLFTTNLSRLATYSGGAHYGVALDYARRHLVRGRFKSAKRIMDTLRSKSDSGVLSPEYRIEILTMDCAVTLVLYHEKPELLAVDDLFWRDLAEAIMLLLQLTDHQNYTPANLKARILQHRLEKIIPARFKGLIRSEIYEPQTEAQLKNLFHAAGMWLPPRIFNT